MLTQHICNNLLNKLNNKKFINSKGLITIGRPNTIISNLTFVSTPDSHNKKETTGVCVDVLSITYTKLGNALKESNLIYCERCIKDKPVNLDVTVIKWK